MGPTEWFALKLSFEVGLASTVIVAVSGTAVAYLLAKRSFPGKGLVDALCTLPLVLPPTVTGYYLVVLLGRHGPLGELLYEWTGWSVTFTPWAAVIASTVVAFPLMFKTSRAAIASVDPTLEQAAFTLGRSELQTALRVTLPLAWRGLLAGAILAFARAMGEFGATLMLAGNIPGKTATMPLVIYSAAASGDIVAANTLVAVHTLFALTVIVLAQRWGG